MFTRLVSFAGARDINGGIDYLRETVTPLLHEQRGFHGTTASADRGSGVFGVLTLWETEADRDASESALAKTREEGLKIIGGTLSVEYFEETYAELITRPWVGAALLIRRLSMDPKRIDDNARYFQDEVLPLIKASDGLLGVRHMVNRTTGDALVGTAWKDVASMEAAAKEAAKRQDAAKDRVTFGEQSRREVVFIDLP